SEEARVAAPWARESKAVTANGLRESDPPLRVGILAPRLSPHPRSPISSVCGQHPRSGMHFSLALKQLMPYSRFMKRRREMVPAGAPGRRWGGRRKGRGRPKVKGVVPHRTRPEVAGRFPLHNPNRIRGEVGSLRTDRRFARIKQAFRYG